MLSGAGTVAVSVASGAWPAAGVATSGGSSAGAVSCSGPAVPVGAPSAYAGASASTASPVQAVRREQAGTGSPQPGVRTTPPSVTRVTVFVSSTVTVNQAVRRRNRPAPRTGSPPRRPSCAAGPATRRRDRRPGTDVRHRRQRRLPVAHTAPSPPGRVAPDPIS